MRIDINADVGEGMASDAELLDIATSANVACGFHAGDRETMAATVRASARRRVAVGAHPGLADRAHFGRRVMQLSRTEVYDLVTRQVAAILPFIEDAGATLSHVKPHGALYHMAEARDDVASAICAAVLDVAPGARVYGLASGRLISNAVAAGMIGIGEVFADRAYLADGWLAPRTHPGAVISDSKEAARRMVRWILSGEVEALGGGTVVIRAQTICVHGDNAVAVETATAVRQALESAGIAIAAVGAV